jgi:hypothetical protein
MTFFLLKWIFNAIKETSSKDDPKLQGLPYVNKASLVKQLIKNRELMTALGYKGAPDMREAIKKAPSAKDNTLMWAEFLDFFFLRQASL